MTTPMNAGTLVKNVKDVLKKTKQKDASILFKVSSGHEFKIGDIAVDENGNIFLLEADRYSAPIGFH